MRNVHLALSFCQMQLRALSRFVVAPLALALALLLAGPAALAAKKKPPLRPINLNTATSAELQQVPGIGPSTADKILKMRKSYGPFKSVDDLRAIKGIGPKRLEKMRRYLTVSTPTTAKKPPAAPAAAHTPATACSRPAAPPP
jgi:competence ComEA-like helix-hairpin-helix protein